MAPRRPALLPAILFVSAFWISSTGFPIAATLVTGGLAILALARWCACIRRVDVALLILAGSAGILCAWQTIETRAHALGSAALVLPIGVPFERSWSGTLEASPKRIDSVNWLLRVSAYPEVLPRLSAPLRLLLEVPLRRDIDRAGLAALRAGDEVRFWARIRLGPEDALGRGTIKSPGLIEPLERSDSSPRYILQRYRDRLQRRLQRLYGADDRLAGFLSAVLLGERSARDPPWESRLRACGLSHLLAISGLHIGIVAAFLLAVARHALRRPWWRVFAIGGSLCMFGVLVGGATPVQRAVGGAAGLLLGCALGREGDPLNRLACLAVAVGLGSPGASGTTAYVLSFAATAGILLAIHPSRLQPLRISVSAYLATAPLSALYFGQLAPWAPLANLLAFPCLVLLLSAGYASLLFAGIPYVGAASTGMTRLGFAGIERISDVLDAQPLSPLFVAAPHPAICVLALASGCTGWLAPQRTVRGAARVVFALIIVGLHLGPPPADFASPGAALLDVGQGQALFWHDDGETTLIDAAGRGYGRWDPGTHIVRPALLERGVRRLDRLVLSHGHADHAAGAFAIIDTFEIGQLWLGPGWWHDPRLADLAAHARSRGAAVRLVSLGDRATGVRILGPSDETVLTDNAASLVLALGTGPWSLFVPGDLDGAALQSFLSENPPGKAGAIVLAHHGSRHGTPEALLNALRPDFALVSNGWKNRFGHPHREVIERLDRRGIPLWRTDHHGTIELTAGPRGWRIESER